MLAYCSYFPDLSGLSGASYSGTQSSFSYLLELKGVAWSSYASPQWRKAYVSSHHVFKSPFLLFLNVMVLGGLIQRLWCSHIWLQARHNSELWYSWGPQHCSHKWPLETALLAKLLAYLFFFLVVVFCGGASPLSCSACICLAVILPDICCHIQIAVLPWLCSVIWCHWGSNLWTYAWEVCAYPQNHFWPPLFTYFAIAKTELQQNWELEITWWVSL